MILTILDKMFLFSYYALLVVISAAGIWFAGSVMFGKDFVCDLWKKNKEILKGLCE